MEIHRFWNQKPSRAEIFRIWNAAKRLGEIPASWSYARHGELRQCYSGLVLCANA